MVAPASASSATITERSSAVIRMFSSTGIQPVHSSARKRMHGLETRATSKSKPLCFRLGTSLSRCRRFQTFRHRHRLSTAGELGEVIAGHAHRFAVFEADELLHDVL